jgi:hypothetical protein
VSIADIARVTGHDRKTVRKYLADDAATVPPSAPSRRGTQPRKIDRLVPVVEAWLCRDLGGSLGLLITGRCRSAEG